MYNPKISIIVPIYNVSSYLKRCVNSILNQTYTNFEILLIDDNSTDNSGILVDYFSQRDNRVKAYHNATNKGVAHSRNVGLKKATGEYITFVDPDDVIKSSYLRNLLTTLIRNDTEISVCQFTRFESIKDIDFGDTTLKTVKVLPSKKATEMILYQIDGFDVSCWGKLYKASLFKNMVFKSGVIFEDFQLIPFIFLNAITVSFIYNEDYAYFKRSSSIMKSNFDSQRMMILDISYEVYSELSTINSSLSDAAAAKGFSATSEMLFKSIDGVTSDKYSLELWKAVQFYADNFSLFGNARLKNKIAKLLSMAGMRGYVFFLKKYYKV